MKIRNCEGRLLRGQIVEVRSTQEISAMLDINGKSDDVPFVPEMIEYSGAQAHVFRLFDFPARRIILEQTGAMVQLSNTVAHS